MATASAHRAAVLVKPQTTQVQLAPVSPPGPSQVRVRLEGCGICASNLAVWEGRPWFEYPRAAGSPGHEGWGRIDAIGAGVEGLERGDRVAMISGNAYAELDVAAADAIVKLPPELDALPFPGEPLGCAMNIFERSDVRAGHKVAIVGAGFLGVLLTQLATHAGAQVVVLSRRAYALDLARRAGACEVISTEQPSARDDALRLTQWRGFDRVIEAVGVQSSLDLATAITAEYAKLIIAGYHQDGPRQVDMQQWNWRALDVINAHERSTSRYVGGVSRAVEAVMCGRMDPFPLLTHRVALPALDQGFALTRDRPDGFMKAVMTLAEPA